MAPAWVMSVGRRGLPPAADGVLAVATATFAVLDLTVLRLTAELSARPMAAAPFAVLIPGCLALRRRRVVTATLVAAALIVVQTFTVAATTSLAEVVTLLLLACSLGTHGGVRGGLAGLAACLTAIALVAVRSADSAGGVLSIVPFLAVPFLAGVAVRAARGYGRRLEELAAQLEAERERGAWLAVAEERARIARELHDVVSHGVGVMAIQAGGARRIIDRDVGRARQALSAIETSGRAALVELERMVAVLRAPGDEAADGATDTIAAPTLDELPGLVDRLRSGGVDVRLECEGAPPPLPPAFGLAMYRIVQEALTNAARHAPGAGVRVRLEWTATSVTVLVCDTGPSGPVVPAARGGHGLIGMRERVRLFGGELETGPLPGGGYRVHARLPLPERP